MIIEEVGANRKLQSADHLSSQKNDNVKSMQLRNRPVSRKSLPHSSGHMSIEEHNQKQGLSQQQLRSNKKITDYFTIAAKSQQKRASLLTSAQNSPQNCKWKQNVAYHEMVPELLRSNSYKQKQMQILKHENQCLMVKLDKKEETGVVFLENYLQSIITVHRMMRDELNLKISHNNIRLGKYLFDRKGRKLWVDGYEMKSLKQTIANIRKEKEEIQQLMKKIKHPVSKAIQQLQQYENTMISRIYFLSREATHYQSCLHRLEEQRYFHAKQSQLLYQQIHSKYGKASLEVLKLQAWPKISKYQLLGLLGKGGFSEVYKAVDTDDLREVACKVHQFDAGWSLATKESYIKHALRENSVHKMLRHQNIVSLYDTVQIDRSSFCTVLEYCSGPDLSQYLRKHKRIGEREAKVIIKQVINAIIYLYQLPEKVIHYDLKPQNILFHKGRIKVTDFGLCKTTKMETIELTSQGVGTYWYLPPECFQVDKKAVISPKVDVWSIGVIYFQLLYGQKPFGNQISQARILREEIILNAKMIKFPETPKGQVSQQSKNFITACLKFQVEERIGIKELKSHKLFEKK